MHCFQTILVHFSPSFVVGRKTTKSYSLWIFRQRQSILYCISFGTELWSGSVESVCADIPACFLDNKILDSTLKLHSNQHQPYHAKWT